MIFPVKDKGQLTTGARLKSISHALTGLGDMLRTEPNAWIHLAFTAAALLILGMAGSVWMLRAAYLYSKQDFVGAMEAVEAARQPDEPVVTVGMTAIPYRDYYRREWPAVGTAEELKALRGRGSRVWLLYTSPIHLSARYPDIWNIIQSEFTTVRVFRGTLGNGEVYLCQAPPRQD